MARRRPGKSGGRPARAKGQPVAAPAGDQPPAGRTAGYALVLIYLAGSFCTGVMGLAFVLLAIWLAYSEIAAAGEVRLKLLMMPMMNILVPGEIYIKEEWRNNPFVKKSICP